MIDEFVSAQAKAVKDIVARLKESELASRVEDIEDNQELAEELIPKLTPSDDLETVKRVLNQVIDRLSKN